MDSTAPTTLSGFLSIHRNSSGAIINLNDQYPGFQKLRNMVMLCKQSLCVQLLASGSNKSINADCQTVAVFLKARCAAGYFKRYKTKETMHA